MAMMTSYKITDFGGPITAVEQPVPEPSGTEVLVRVTRCGVCHSDIHIADGFYDLGDGKRLSLGDRGINLPRAMGHEALGVVEKAGPDADDAPIGETRLVYPWVGCGECSICEADKENHCAKPRSLGVFMDGGYAEYILVPHPKHLVEIGDMDPSVAAPFACSGLTVYGALKKALPVEDDEWLVIMGAGGLGLIAVSIAKAMGVANVLSCDIDPAKLDAAREAGASATLNTADGDAGAGLLAAVGGTPPVAVLDTVGSEATSGLGIGALIKGGRYVVVGLYGGGLSLALPSIPLRAISIIGSYTGNLPELRELMALVRAGKVKPIPVTERPLSEAGPALEDLRKGGVVGRQVLVND